ncbi:GatB/YqeY domain-containing protein [bacterium]|nr:GatB/YqeY domain-containing protein [bacterium]
MSLTEQIVQDLKQAMSARDQQRVDTLRLIRAEMLKAEKEKGQALTEERAMEVMQRMLKQRTESIEQFTAAGRADLADKERAEAEIIKAYLPEPLTEAEIDAAIDAVLAQAGPVDPRQMGKIMGQVMGKLKGMGKPVDGKVVGERVKAKLG